MKSMNTEYTNFLMYTKWITDLKNFPAEKFKRLFLALNDYVADGKETNFTDEPDMEFPYNTMKDRIDIDKKNYEAAKLAKSEGGKKAMAKRWNKDK